ncbi:hypothetical protein GCM10009544_59760 [Streptomyces stramineus]|uniref:Malate synthase TIM barrel domain-containing protein n=1 Tax=Streptomyces stramineus TaxID=173861 RepID=A0ABP3L0X8_9ACTN
MSLTTVTGRAQVLGAPGARFDEILTPAALDAALPDRAKVTPTAPFPRASTELPVRTCHRRGAHAIGGTAARLPGRDARVNEAALFAPTALADHLPAFSTTDAHARHLVRRRPAVTS